MAWYSRSHLSNRLYTLYTNRAVLHTHFYRRILNRMSDVHLNFLECLTTNGQLIGEC